MSAVAEEQDLINAFDCLIDKVRQLAASESTGEIDSHKNALNDTEGTMDHSQLAHHVENIEFRLNRELDVIIKQARQTAEERINRELDDIVRQARDIIAAPKGKQSQITIDHSVNSNSSKHVKCPRWSDLIGNTPLIDLSRMSPNPNVQILAKVEFLNPSHSIKDRMVSHVLNCLEEKKQITPHKDQCIVASSSGNTGAALSMLAQQRGYKAVIVTSEKCSKEKQSGITVYGAELVVTPAGVPSDSPEHYGNVGPKIAEERGGYDLDQYNNPLNPDAYYHSLGPEIWKQTDGRLDYFIAGGSTGGTITGTGRFLKEQNKDIKVILPDPVGSCLYNAFKTGDAGQSKGFFVEGVGKDSIPGAIDFQYVDDVMQLSDKECFDVCRKLAQKEGILVGGSSGLNVGAAMKIASTIEHDKHVVIVCVLPDSGIKYFSKIYNDEWMNENGFIKDSEDESDPESDSEDDSPP